MGILWYLCLDCAGVLGLAGSVVPYATGVSQLNDAAHRQVKMVAAWEVATVASLHEDSKDFQGLYSKMLDLAQVVQDPGAP